MFVNVSKDERITLEERENFRAFKLTIDAGTDRIEAMRLTLSGIAELVDEKTAWISEGALRNWAGVAQDAAWQQSLSAMIEKARPHGWIDDRRKAIRAHIEWREPAA